MWIVQGLFVKQEANARRSFMSNQRGSDLTTNTGRKERSRDRRAALQFILSGYDAMPKQDLITMLAHEMAK